MTACLRENPATCASLSGEVISQRPSAYPGIYTAGKACLKMGLKDQAGCRCWKPILKGP